MSAAEPCPPGTGVLDAETGPQNSRPETKVARRDQKDPKPVAQIPAQTAYLNLAGKYPVRRDWVVVEAVTCEPVSLLLGDYQRCFREKQRRGSPEMPEMPVPQAFLRFRV